MSLSALFAIDVLAIVVLTFGIYFPRHRRKDMLVAFLAINIGVLGITQALSSAQISAGLGLGLFGVLSIIRLRSSEMDQQEIAYYFAALALGLLGGFPVSPSWLSPALMGATVAAIFIADHPALFSHYRSHLITLDKAYTNESTLRLRLEQLLDAKVHRVTVRKIDLVNDTTIVDVQYRQSAGGETPDSAYAAADLEVGRGRSR
jgi:hypothetical protein